MIVRPAGSDEFGGYLFALIFDRDLPNSECRYCEDCPSHEQALERLQKVLQEEGVRVKLEVVEVQTDEQAKHLHFIGSPTILIDSRDIDPQLGSSYSAGACRVYRLDDGRISPLPSEDMIRRAVRAAIKNP